MLAAFHIHERDVEIEGSISPADVPGLAGSSEIDESFIVYEATRRQLMRLEANEQLPVRLQPNEASLYVILREQPVVTPIGLVQKLLSADAVLTCRTTGRQTTVT
ncbi:hypothetical protein XYCOK13_33480 [Xylanibacillus composti]|uniref:Uncharacterized protein n=1 Tax=Xylanibacillus composti TaxID=1572762 RepID=A0A8J4H7R6_9BACL|nr:hypothetical protein XYCOK13_33480 [Xylanibacillus composti]